MINYDCKLTQNSEQTPFFPNTLIGGGINGFVMDLPNLTNWVQMDTIQYL